MFGRKKDIDEQKLQEAVENLTKGSAEAFQILYTKYNQKVYRFCLRILGDDAQAKDAFQETFIRVFENKDSFRGDNFGAWLFTIARHTCLNMIRSRRLHESLDEAYHMPMQTVQEDVALKDHIEKAIQKVPITLREALVLREYEECTYQEIADILGIDLSLAKVRVYRARVLLRKMLKPIVKELNES